MIGTFIVASGMLNSTGAPPKVTSTSERPRRSSALPFQYIIAIVVGLVGLVLLLLLIIIIVFCCVCRRRQKLTTGGLKVAAAVKEVEVNWTINKLDVGSRPVPRRPIKNSEPKTISSLLPCGWFSSHRQRLNHGHVATAPSMQAGAWCQQQVRISRINSKINTTQSNENLL